MVAQADERGPRQQVGETAQFFQGGGGGGVLLMLVADRVGLGLAIFPAPGIIGGGPLGVGAGADVRAHDPAADPRGAGVIAPGAP